MNKATVSIKRDENEGVSTCIEGNGMDICVLFAHLVYNMVNSDLPESLVTASFFAGIDRYHSENGGDKDSELMEFIKEVLR